MINQEAKFRLLYQDQIDEIDKFLFMFFKGEYKSMRFEQILNEKQEGYFAIEFYESYKGLEYVERTFFNPRAKSKPIIMFEKEILDDTERKNLYSIIRKYILKLYTKITGEQASFIDAVKYLFSQNKEPDDIDISGELNITSKYIGFKNPVIKDDEDEYADKQAKHILLDKKRI